MNHDQNPRSDEQLMEAFVQGSADAFSSLFERYRQRIFGFFCRRVVERSVAEELTQETFLAVLRGATRYQPNALFRTWLYAVALNILRAHGRKTIFRAFFSGKAEEHHEPTAPNTMEATFLLREAVGKLNSSESEILLLREFEELSYAEIATVLRLPINTVRTRLFRARNALHNLLTEPVADTREVIDAEEQS